MTEASDVQVGLQGREEALSKPYRVTSIYPSYRRIASVCIMLCDLTILDLKEMEYLHVVF